MIIQEIVEDIESQREDISKLCSELVKIPTPNPPGDTEECVNFIQSYFKRLGISTKIFKQKGRKANICARLEGDDPKTILWLGHIDVVPEGNREAWRYDPYSGKINEQFVYGRGSSDMKDSCAAAMIAAKTQHEMDRLPYNVEYWFTCDEEVGGGKGAKWLSQEGIIKGEVCIIGDSFGSTPIKPYIDLGCKGMIWTKIKTEGKTAHGSMPYLGDNAINKLLRVIKSVKKIEEQRLNIPEDLVDVLKSSTKYLLEDEDLSEDKKEEVKRLFYHPTTSLNVLRGGVKTNIVPDYAESEIDIRLTPGVVFAKIEKKIQDLINESKIDGVTVEFQKGKGYYEPPNTKFTKQLSETVQTVTGLTPIYKVLTGGTDAISLRWMSNIPCLGFGAGLRGQAHAPNEYTSIENMVMVSKVYAIFPYIFNP
jgi:succinyl-diaminopimelate desuccinylase